MYIQFNNNQLSSLLLQTESFNNVIVYFYNKLFTKWTKTNKTFTLTYWILFNFIIIKKIIYRVENKIYYMGMLHQTFKASELEYHERYILYHIETENTICQYVVLV